MLSPEAELQSIVNDLVESTDPADATHVSKRECRRLISQAVRATLQICFTPTPDPVKMFLLDLDTAKGRTGV